MNARLLLLTTVVIAPALVMAQVDEWSTFPSGQPPTTTQPQQPPKKPAEPAKPEAKKPDEKKKDEKKPDANLPVESLSGAPANASPATAAPAPSSATPAPAPAPAPATATSSMTPPPAAEDASATDTAVVSQQERFLPGTEPHSPSTWGNSFNDTLNRRVAPSAVGSVGLLHVSSAALGPKGVLRFSALGEYLNQNNFPVLDARDVRSAGTFAVSFVPLPWLEAFLAYGASANTNNFSSPTLIQALGDVSLGAKAAREWAKGFSAGLELKLQSFSGVGNQDVRRYAWGISPKLVATYDLRQPLPKVPVLLHANLGIAFDGTGGLVKEHTLNASEEFALNVNRYNRFTTGLALEVPLPAVTPFLEYNLGVPLGVSGGTLIAPNGEEVALTAAMPQSLGVGAKVTAVKDLTFTLGADFGLSRTVGRGVPATPPWNAYVGAAFNIDPFQRGETRVVETLRERKVEQAAAPKTSKVDGVVVDAQTQKPIPGVIVAMVGAGLPPVASDVDSGRFLTHELQPGAVTLKAEKDGYKEVAQEVRLEPGQVTKVQLVLEPEAKLAHFLVTVNGGGKKKAPLPAEVKFKGAKELALQTTADQKEPAKLDAPPDKYTVTVVADGYLAQTREVQVVPDAEMKLDFTLEAQPKKKLVVIKEDKIEILQQVHFQTGKATILADSYSLLNQVVDAIVTNGVKKIRVEGHTDNRGGQAKNMKLSQDRAQAVADYLIKQGIDPSRIEAEGFGPTRPVAPNLTARGRELNRRVEFVILER